jgi:hypothetical protein
LLRDDPSLLQLPLDLLRVGLLLLHLVQQHADLLWQLLSRLPKPWDPNAFETRPLADIGGDEFFCAADKLMVAEKLEIELVGAAAHSTRKNSKSA